MQGAPEHDVGSAYSRQDEDSWNDERVQSQCNAQLHSKMKLSTGMRVMDLLFFVIEVA